MCSISPPRRWRCSIAAAEKLRRVLAGTRGLLKKRPGPVPGSRRRGFSIAVRVPASVALAMLRRLGGGQRPPCSAPAASRRPRRHDGRPRRRRFRRRWRGAGRRQIASVPGVSIARCCSARRTPREQIEPCSAASSGTAVAPDPGGADRAWDRRSHYAPRAAPSCGRPRQSRRSAARVRLKFHAVGLDTNDRAQSVAEHGLVGRRPPAISAPSIRRIATIAVMPCRRRPRRSHQRSACARCRAK